MDCFIPLAQNAQANPMVLSQFQFAYEDHA
jgi:hypothetical protein